MQAIEDPVAAFNAHLEKRKAMSDKLAIIDKEEFEEWLLARVLIMKCEADYQSLLMSLKLRLDALGVGDKRHHQSVFGPALLVSAFQPVIQSLVEDSTTEKRIFRLFEQMVMLRLEGLYQALNNILIEHKILPKLNFKQGLLVKNVQPIKLQKPEAKKSITNEPNADNKTREPAGKTHSGSQHISYAANAAEQSSRLFSLPPFSADLDRSDLGRSNIDSAAAENTVITASQGYAQNQRNAQSAISNISQLLRKLNPEQKSKAEQTEAKPAYSVSEFEQGLAVLQAANSENHQISDNVSLMERVREKLKQAGEEKVIDDHHKTAIDVVDRFFLSMRHNPRISDEAKQYLLKLDVPILKVLLKDEGFFENRQSTVRAVINRIAQLGAKDAKLHPSSKQKIDQLVNKVITEFDEDTSVFDQALNELDKLLERQNHVYVKNVERVAAAAEGAFKVEEANLAVTQAINQRIAHKFVPSAVITLLNEGWKDYLNLSHIKYGEDSLAWQEALSVIDRLIAYGDDPRMPIDIKVLLPKIQEGLKLVSGTNEAPVQVRDALKAFILNAPKGLHLSEQAQHVSLPETEEDLIKRNISKTHALKDWVMKVKAIPLGSWFSFTKPDEQTHYIRLVWVAKGYSKFVFVNHQGMRVVELGLLKLADYFKEGLIHLDSDYEVPIVNQGLEDMVKDVYERLAYESSHDSDTGLINRAEFCRQVRLMMKQGKRTSACSLLFIRFRHDSQEILTLAEAFAKQVVETLQDLPATQTILGRIEETDFVIFSAIDDSSGFRLACQEALIYLCKQSEHASPSMRVTLGESRAHLGFNNPESMIKHASEALARTKPLADTKTIISEQSDAASRINLEPVVSLQLSDSAANTEPDELEFERLKFEIYSQTAAAILVPDPTGEVVSTKVVLKPDAQLNLVYFIKGEAQAYFPENEAAANALDAWWLKTLEHLQVRDEALFAGYDCVRVSLSAYVFNSQERIEQLLALADSGRLVAAKLCFDVYDCFQIEDVELAAIRMNMLKQAGYRFCLEHFGTTRCPFAYLKALPADMIKIDDSFVVALNTGQPDSALESDAGVNEASADSIVEIAHYLAKQVLATVVDSAVCLQKMKHLKVDYVQGSTVAKFQKYEL